MKNIKVMARIYKFALIASVFATLVSSCSQGDAEVGDPSVHKVVVQAGIETKSDVVYKSGEGSGIDLSQISKPTLDQFMINVKSDKDNFNSTYEELSQGVELPIGKYDLLASCGENVVAGWNNSYYEGRSSFVLSNDQTQVDLSLQCGIGSALAYAVFDDKFRAAFSSFNVEFCTENNVKDPLVFGDGEKRIATFKPANKLWVVVNATKRSNGKMYRYGIDPVMGVKAGELNVFHFTVQDGTVGFNVTVDNGYKVVEKKAMLDSNWADDRFTNMLMSFDANNTVLFVAGMKSSKTYDVVFATNVGLKNLYLSFDEAFAAELGFDRVDMLNLTPQEKEIVDNRIGAVLTVNTGNDGYRLSLSGCKDKLQMRAGGMTEFTFSIQSVDNIGKVENASIDITMIEIKVDEFTNSRVWNRFAFIPAPYIVGVETSTMLELPFEYWIKEGSGDWKSLGVKNDKGEVRLNDLKPATNYQTKVTFEEFILAESAFRTHTEGQIPNNDFSQFKEETCGGTKYPYLNYEFTNTWATLNALTVDKNEVGWARSYPNVRVIDGAAEISTIGYGYNGAGTPARIEHYKTGTLFNKKDQMHTKDWGNYAVGKVFLGTYSVANGERHGRDFDSKPTGVKFRYKFSCKNSNGPWSMQLRLLASGGEEVGRTDFAGSNVNQGGFVELTVPIKYNANYNSKSIVNMELYFVSQTGSVAANDGNLNIQWGSDKRGDCNGWGTSYYEESVDSRHCGNVLAIDDVIMVYPNNPEDYQIK